MVACGPTVPAMTDGAALRPFRIEVPQTDLDDLADRLAATRWPAGRPTTRGRKACRSTTSRSWLLGRQLRLAPPRGQAQRVAPVPHDHRRCRRPRRHQIAGARCPPAGDDPRLAGLDRRVPRRRRPPDGSPSAWRRPGRCLRPRAPQHPGLRLLTAGRRRLDGGACGQGMGRADAPPGLPPLRRPGRRLGIGHLARGGARRRTRSSACTSTARPPASSPEGRSPTTTWPGSPTPSRPDWRSARWAEEETAMRLQATRPQTSPMASPTRRSAGAGRDREVPPVDSPSPTADPRMPSTATSSSPT